MDQHPNDQTRDVAGGNENDGDGFWSDIGVAFAVAIVVAALAALISPILSLISGVMVLVGLVTFRRVNPETRWARVLSGALIAGGVLLLGGGGVYALFFDNQEEHIWHWVPQLPHRSEITANGSDVFHQERVFVKVGDIEAGFMQPLTIVREGREPCIWDDASAESPYTYRHGGTEFSIDIDLTATVAHTTVGRHDQGAPLLATNRFCDGPGHLRPRNASLNGGDVALSPVGPAGDVEVRFDSPVSDDIAYCTSSWTNAEGDAETEELQLNPGGEALITTHGLVGTAIDIGVWCSVGEPSAIDPDMWTWDSQHFLLGDPAG